MIKEQTTTLRIILSSAVTAFGLIIVVGFVILAIVVWVTKDAILPYSPYTITSALLEPPSFVHIFGTDNLGRDVLSRQLAASPYDAEVPAAVLAISVTLGVLPLKFERGSILL